MKFKKCGILLLESINGDVLLAAPDLKIDTMVTSELLDRAEVDDKKAIILARQFLNFIRKQRSDRWIQAKKDLIEIAEVDTGFVKRLKAHIEAETIEALRKIEKDIFFWKQENGKMEIHMIKKQSIQT